MMPTTHHTYTLVSRYSYLDQADGYGPYGQQKYHHNDRMIRTIMLPGRNSS